GAQRTDLAECRFHLVDQEIDHVEWTFGAERAEAPQKGFAGERGIGPRHERAVLTARYPARARRTPGTGLAARATLRLRRRWRGSVGISQQLLRAVRRYAAAMAMLKVRQLLS